MLADPSASIRKVVELAFADEKIDVSSAADAQAAMHRFVEIQPDIVLVDVELPGTSGYQICEMIKQDEATKDIPVLLLVGSFVPFDQDEAERVGADGFMTKPFHSIRDLVIRVNEALGREIAVPVGVAVATPVPTPITETDDIEDLYRDSFAVTAEIEEFDTLDDLLGDAGMDDDMIETSRPDVEDDVEEFVPIAQASAAESVKEFDWSPAKEPVSEPDSTKTERTTPKFVFEDTPESTVPPVIPTAPSVPTADMVQDLSPELIDRIAKVVVDRLSDRIIREVAQDAVPKIAEKLMREALDAESKPRS